jgi:hypothetical protein
LSNQYTEISYREDPDRREDRSELGYERKYFTDRIESMYRDLKISSTYYKEVLRSLLSSMKVNYLDEQGDYKDVKIHHGRQERIIAKKFQENNLILPYSTIYQSAINEDTKKRRSWSVLNYGTVWDDETQRAQRTVSYPDIPVIMEYTFSVWSKYISHLDQISSQIRSQFNPHKNLNIMDTNVLKAYLSKEEDISKTDVGDKEERLVRKTFTVSVEGYIPSPKFLLTNTGKIIHINTEIWV